MVNIIGDKYLLAGNVVTMDKQWGLKQPGGKLDSFIETADVSTTLGHGVGQMTDSAAVVSLFTDMAKTTLGGLSMKEQFSYLNKILKEVGKVEVVAFLVDIDVSRCQRLKKYKPEK